MATKSPDAFRTISEVADWLGVQAHVLRFWESKFSQVKPVKRAGGRRYYRPNDMLLLGGIQKLLHEDGLTIKGAQKVLREEGMAHVAGLSKPLDGVTEPEASASAPMSEAPSTPLELDAEPASGEVVAFAPNPNEDGAETTSDTSVEKADEQAPTAENNEEKEGFGDELPLFMRQAEPRPEPDQTEASVTDAKSETEEPTLPAFLREASETEGAPHAQKQSTPAPGEAQTGELDKPDGSESHITEQSSDVPGFLRSEHAVSEERADATPAQETSDIAEPQEAARVAPRPDVVDIPDINEDALTAAETVLSKVFTMQKLSAAQRADMTPLIAQLAALRDKMGAGRGRGFGG